MSKLKKSVERLNFSKIDKVIDLPDLIEVQKNSYDDFINSPKSEHNVEGVLETVFKEIFPILDYNETIKLEFLSYSVEKSKYTASEAIDRSTTYAVPLKIKVRLVTYDNEDDTTTVKDAKESEVYLCDIPLMTDKGTFIINGVERVVVSQLHRSPGIFFEDLTAEKSITEKHLYSARIIPYRGSWIDFEYDSKDVLYVRIDKKRKLLVSVLLRALGMSTNDILSTYYKFEDVTILDEYTLEKSLDLTAIAGQKLSYPILDSNGAEFIKAGKKITKAAIKKLSEANIVSTKISFEELEGLDTFFAEDIADKDGEIIVNITDAVSEPLLRELASRGINQFKTLYIDKSAHDSVIRDILVLDKISTQEEALIEIYKKLRPGEPATIDGATSLFNSQFFENKRYDLSRVGRLKINKRLGLDLDLGNTVLTKEDIVNTVMMLESIRKGSAQIDDIDHLGHRRVRAAGEQLQNYMRIGLTRMEKTAKERMSIQDVQDITAQDLLNAKAISASIKEFFGSYQLSQFMDQINPLSEITHKRRLSALGPGGLNRDRAGFEVRDVHTSHYGRICPIETPEGPNIGLITSLTTHAKVNEFGFIETPYRKVTDGICTRELVYLSAIEEEGYYIAQANSELDKEGRFVSEFVAARYMGEPSIVESSKIDYMDVAPMQIVSVSTSLIPFLEHDDANRALMGSNMQRQGVPLIKTERPIVGTGMERKIATDAGASIIAPYDAIVEYVDADRIILRYGKEGNFDIQIFNLVKYRRSNQDTCINYKPIVDLHDSIEKNCPIADGPAIDSGELALGRNIVVAFMPWMGFNYEDSILVSKKLVKEDVFTSIHIESFEVEARDTKLGAEDITRDIPNVRDGALRNLDEAGVIRVGAKVKPGDILVGKITPKGESQVTPEEKLLRAIFGEKAGDVKDASLRVSPGIHGVVIDVQIMTRRGIEKDSRALAIEKEDYDRLLYGFEVSKKSITKARVSHMAYILSGAELAEDLTIGSESYSKGENAPVEALETLDYHTLNQIMVVGRENLNSEIDALNANYNKKLAEIEDNFKERVKKIEKSDELPAGVLKLVKVSVAIKRRLSVGDKMAGRHGNKGVVSCILPEQDMPYLPDGTPVELVLNPLGVPSRMNIGQVLEVHLGWAARALDIHVATEVFDGANEEDIKKLYEKAGIQSDGQTILYDGRTGERFHQEVTVGVMYMLKLHHLVDSKIHARSTGPYSLVTQQPLGGKAQFGGQRLGEMEVWALEAYGAANILQEMLTVKSDDVEGRTKVFESIVNGNYTFKPSLPESFNVLIKELQGLSLDIELIINDETPVKEAENTDEAKVTGDKLEG